MKYTASFDKPVKVISSLVTIMMFSFIVFSVLKISPSSDIISNSTHLFIIFTLLAILLICYILSPQYYVLNESDLVIKMIKKDRKIIFSDIAEIRLLDSVELRGVMRTFGVGGLFGYFGIFASLKLGKMHWYATQSKNKVLITLNNGEKVVITPDDITLIEKIRSNIDARIK